MSCQKEIKVSTFSKPLVTVQKQNLELKPNEGLMYYNHEPFTGYSILYSRDSTLAQRTAYNSGKRHGLYEKWFVNGIKSFESHYQSGLQHGITISWWKNGHKRSENNYVNGIAQGMQYQWYTDGSIFKEIQLVDGKEHGMQKSYRPNGKLYNNYEAKNGRIFGLKKATLCFSLENQEVVSDSL